MTFTEPMLAASLLDPEVEHTDEAVYEAMSKLKYPVIATLKLDGIRGLRLNGTLLSRRLKPIPNKFISSRSLLMPGGFDVELFRPGMEYNDIQSIVMSQEHDGSYLISFHVLDWFIPSRPYLGYEQRLDEIDMYHFGFPERCSLVMPSVTYCDNADQLLAFEKQCIEDHGEGICFRLPNSPYKCGRSTLKEQYLVKLSRFSREEAVIVGFKEQMENGNPDKRCGTGKMNRSTCSALQYGKGTLGAFIVRNDKGQEFPIGTGVGLTDKLRLNIWQNQDKYLGRTLTYKTKAHGTKLLPRQPIMVGWRNEGE